MKKCKLAVGTAYPGSSLKPAGMLIIQSDEQAYTIATRGVCRVSDTLKSSSILPFWGYHRVSTMRVGDIYLVPGG